MMTDTPDLSVLRAAAEAATPGGWHTTRTSYGLTVDNADEEMIFVETHGVTWTPNPADAEFIAAADPATVLALIVRLQDAEAVKPKRPPRPPACEKCDALWTPGHVCERMPAELTQAECDALKAAVASGYYDHTADRKVAEAVAKIIANRLAEVKAERDELRQDYLRVLKDKQIADQSISHAVTARDQAMRRPKRWIDGDYAKGFRDGAEEALLSAADDIDAQDQRGTWFENWLRKRADQYDRTEA